MKRNAKPDAVTAILCQLALDACVGEGERERERERERLTGRQTDRLIDRKRDGSSEKWKDRQKKAMRRGRQVFHNLVEDFGIW